MINCQVQAYFLSGVMQRKHQVASPCSRAIVPPVMCLYDTSASTKITVSVCTFSVYIRLILHWCVKLCVNTGITCVHYPIISNIGTLQNNSSTDRSFLLERK